MGSVDAGLPVPSHSSVVGLLPNPPAGHLRPADQDTLEELRFSSGRHVEPVVAAPSVIAEGIRTAYEGELAELVNNLPRVRRRFGEMTGR